ncbi:hypothetical protein MuYL_4360 [Mucilaginibacter xinganensis]|uniref:Uncharacterized protein n=1 Tax=Mucilaginibacter xinganensis TaxID=1234841 RepID=A0A223P2A1_9SPHI|nr:hypothetical protein MuYL_4360 [Mucilaginibacter xinganensis]
MNTIYTVLEIVWRKNALYLLRSCIGPTIILLKTATAYLHTDAFIFIDINNRT